jgi:hypothetical protein
MVKQSEKTKMAAGTAGNKIVELPQTILYIIQAKERIKQPG